MIEELIELYGEDFTMDLYHNHPEDFHWFKTKEDNKIFGIKHYRLSDQEKKLIMILAERFPTIHKERYGKWYKYIFEEIPLGEKLTSVRFYYFYTNKSVEERDLFSETICGIFSTYTIVWIDEKCGWIVDESPSITNRLDELSQSLLSLTSDFFIEVKVVVGQLHQVDVSLPQKVQLEMKLVKDFIKDNYQKKALSTFSDVLTAGFIRNYQVSINETLSNYLQIAFQENELVKTIKNYVENNLNVSQTAKKMFMHRNSVQYRIEKFIQLTGIDLKQFQEAITVYLLILHMEFQRGGL